MTRDERLEAGASKLRALMAYPKADGLDDRDVVRQILAAAYPELTAGTHWLAPREATEEMIKAAEDRDDWFPDGMGNASAESHWSAARDAYLKEGGNGG